MSDLPSSQELQELQQPRIRALPYVWRQCWRFPGLTIQSLVLILLMASVNLPLPLLNKITIDYAIPAGEELALIWVGLLALGVRATASGFQVLQNLCLADMGISVWHGWPAKKLVEEGQLQRVLPEWSLKAWEFYAVTTSRHVPAKARALINFLIEEFRPA